MTGLTSEGEKKVRPIDDLSRSGVNANTAASEKLRNDGLDLLVECSSQLRRVAGGREHEVGRLPRALHCFFMVCSRGGPQLLESRHRCCIQEGAHSTQFAFARSLPLPLLLLFASGHRPLAAVAYLFEGTVMVAEHSALPFGSEASVHGWDRVGENSPWPCLP